MSCVPAPSRAAALQRPSIRADRARRVAPVCAQQEQSSSAAAAADRRSVLLGLAGAWFSAVLAPFSCNYSWQGQSRGASYVRRLACLLHIPRAAGLQVPPSPRRWWVPLPPKPKSKCCRCPA